MNVIESSTNNQPTGRHPKLKSQVGGLFRGNTSEYFSGYCTSIY